MGMCQNLVPLVNIKIAGKWMFIPLKIVSIGIDPYPYVLVQSLFFSVHSQLLATLDSSMQQRLSRQKTEVKAAQGHVAGHSKG